MEEEEEEKLDRKQNGPTGSSAKVNGRVEQASDIHRHLSGAPLPAEKKNFKLFRSI